MEWALKSKAVAGDGFCLCLSVCGMIGVLASLGMIAGAEARRAPRHIISKRPEISRTVTAIVCRSCDGCCRCCYRTVCALSRLRWGFATLARADAPHFTVSAFVFSLCPLGHMNYSCGPPQSSKHKHWNLPRREMVPVFCEPSRPLERRVMPDASHQLSGPSRASE